MFTSPESLTDFVVLLFVQSVAAVVAGLFIYDGIVFVASRIEARFFSKGKSPLELAVERKVKELTDA